MKIKQEDFDKLPQLDRIEFMQRKRLLEENRSYLLFSFLKLMFVIFGFILLLAMVSYNISKDLFLALFSLLDETINVAILGVILCGVIDIIKNVKLMKESKKLTEKFFDFKVEAKKNGKK